MAGQARGTDGWASGETVALWLDLGAALPVSGSELVRRDTATWAPAAGGWVQVPGFGDTAPSGTPAASEAGPWTT